MCIGWTVDPNSELLGLLRLNRSPVIIQDRGPLSLITALRECKIKKEDAVMLGKKN